MESSLELEYLEFFVEMGLNKRAFSGNEILYFESENHKTYLVTNSERWIYETPIRELEKQLPSLDFIKISRNTIVNFRYLKKMSNANPLRLLMSDERWLLVSRSRKKEVIRRYNEYIKRQHSPARRFFAKINSKFELKNAIMWAQRNNQARMTIDKYPELSIDDKKKLLYLAQQPQAIWLGEWNADIFNDLKTLLKLSCQSGYIPVFVIYRLFLRHETYAKTLTISFVEHYFKWLRATINVIGSAKCIIILEPNALSSLADTNDMDKENLILELIKQSVMLLKQCPNLKLYIDAGHPNWLDAKHISVYLARAGIDVADGFALNVSNYIGDEANISYGEEISRLLGGKHFVIDTGRNGRSIEDPSQWCNPAGAGLGRLPSFDTGHPLIDGFLWIKPPGESDGESQQGAPQAGTFWLQKAIDLVEKRKHKSY